MKDRKVLLGSSLVFALALSSALAAWLFAMQSHEQANRNRFNALVGEVEEAIVTRMAVYEQVLRGGVGLFNASNTVSRAEWRTYVEGLDIEERFPGIQGIGFSLRIPAAQKERHIAAVRAEGFQGYAIRPDAPRDEYHSIIYLEPFSGRNLRAFGFDMYSEATRRAAMERARDSGRTALSGKVTLVQEADTKVQAGVLMYLPVYTKDSPRNTLSERQKALAGFVYSPFRMDDLMRNAMGAKDEMLRLRIYDGKEALPAAMLFDSAPDAGHPSLSSIRAVSINGQPWLLSFSTRPGFERISGYRFPQMVLAAGLLVSGLLFALSWSLLQARANALAVADTMSAALRASEERTMGIVNTVHDGIITIDEVGTMETVNPAAERIFGWRREELIGRNVRMLMPEPYHSEHDGYLHAYRETGMAKIIGVGREVRGQRRDGTTFPLELAVNELHLADRRAFVGVLRNIGDRKAAEEQTLKANALLKQSVATLERRDRELTLLTRMNDLLMACKDRDEAFGIIRVSLSGIFNDRSGALAIKNDEDDDVTSAIRWGADMTVLDQFALGDCWAVRQGRLYEFADAGSGVACRHVSAPPASGYVCLPLMVQSSMLGVLSVQIRSDCQEAREADLRLVITVGETIKMSLSNLALREALREQAIRDPLTTLYNRRFMEETLTVEVARSLRHQTPLTVAAIDVDFFKKVNDTFGHDAGDRVLRELGHLLKTSLRRSDVPCRSGGEEFVVIMPETSAENALAHLDSIRERFKALSIVHAGQPLGTITLSAGLASLPAHGRDSESVLRAADTALYAAKQGGRNRVVIAGA